MFWSGDRVGRPGVPLFRSDRKLKEWGDSLLQCCGRLRFIEHLTELQRLGLGEFVRVAGEKDTFRFDYTPGATGVESVERMDALYVHNAALRAVNHSKIWDRLNSRRPTVMEKMQTLVRPFGRHYIAYDAHPEVDQYYEELSYALIVSYAGWDAFPQSTPFGMVPFAAYLNCVRVLVAFSMKHLDFVTLLCGASQEVSPVDVIAYPCKWPDAANYVGGALNLDEEEAKQVFSATCVTDESAPYHLKTTSGPIAQHYVFGHAGVVRCATGCLQSPFNFLLRELRRRYPSDWDSSVDAREDVFRNDLIKLFSRFERIVFFSANISITSRIGPTDIDAFAFDPLSRVAALFQLKWQDPFGASIRERESRKSNFLKGGNTWVNKISDWIASGKCPRHLSRSVYQRMLRTISTTSEFSFSGAASVTLVGIIKLTNVRFGVCGHS